MDLGRRNLLRGRRTAAPPPLRPPGALAEHRFIDACTACDRCIDECPERILVRGSGGFPEVDFSRGECTFCSACVDACDDQALDSAAGRLDIAIQVGDGCLAMNQVVCLACGDACEADAISFPPRLGQAAIPRIDAAACVGCGSCVATCPRQALEATPRV
ncbi:MAG: ferredoxin-type protein NapF [Pseudomonadota bacterium]